MLHQIFFFFFYIFLLFIYLNPVYNFRHHHKFMHPYLLQNSTYQWYKFCFYFYFLRAIHLTILLNIFNYFFGFLLSLFMNFFLEFLDFPFLFFFLLLFLKKLDCLLLIFLFIFNFLNCKLKYSTLFYLKHLSFQLFKSYSNVDTFITRYKLYALHYFQKSFLGFYVQANFLLSIFINAFFQFYSFINLRYSFIIFIA